MAFQIRCLAATAAAAVALVLGGGVSAEPQGTVTLFKIAAGECGQVGLDEKFGAIASKFAGLQEGTCADQGYTLAAGSKDITVPVLGELTVALYKKPNLLALLQEGLSPALLGAAAPAGMCCQACSAPRVKYYSVDMKHGHCGECCMNPAEYHLFKIFEPNLTLANGKTCKSLGFPAYDETVTHGIYPVSMTLDLYNPAAVEAGHVVLHRIHDGLCAELTLRETAITRLAPFLGLARGSCSDQGFAVEAGSADLAPMPVQVRFALKEAADAEQSLLLRDLVPALEQLVSAGSGRAAADASGHSEGRAEEVLV